MMIGTRLGPYEITAKLGEGGMGEVWRATDSRLKREVAIKVLPAAFTQDPERLARFEREAQLLAQLHHPHIASIFGLEESNDVRALVMELVEGPTLAERLASGPVPLDEGLALARQIAEALEAAHEKGIVHRDLKPANIKLGPDGNVKVLDFGLAKALDPTTGAPSDLARSPTLTNSPTLTAAGTQLGVILGTAAYMAPEQARGSAIDKRADIWAFGVVLYEMLTGEPLFQGDSAVDTISAVMRQPIDLARLPAATPVRVRELLRRCLERQPKNRLHDIADARLELDEAIAHPDAARGTEAPAGSARSRAFWPLLSGALLLALLGLLWLRPPWRVEHPQITKTSRLTWSLPDGVSPAPVEESSPLVAISPDGTQLAAAAVDRNGNQRLYVRALADLATRPLPGTEGASEPMFSPDGRFLAFFANGELKKVDVAGGAVAKIADAPDSRGGDWGPDGSIVFAPNNDTGLSIVPAAGGAARVLTTPDRARRERTHRWPQVLPGGKAAIYTVGTLDSPDAYDNARIEAVVFASGEHKLVLEGAGFARYFAPTRQLVIGRGGALYAVPFDLETLSASGEPRLVIEGVASDLSTGAVHAAMSGDGTVVYLAGDSAAAESGLGWISESGAVEPLAVPSRPYWSWSLSPDGTKLVALLSSTLTGDLWLYDLKRGTFARLTEGETCYDNAVWSPDGRSVMYTRAAGSGIEVARRAIDGGPAEVLAPWTEMTGYTRSASAVGPRLFLEGGQKVDRRSDLLSLLLVPGSPIETVLSTPADEYYPAISPDGRWLAYVSQESGQGEVYLRRYPGPEGRWQISNQGGGEPRWSADGRTLYFRTATGLARVELTFEPELSVSPPRVLDKIRLPNRRSFTSYAVGKDGRFLFKLPGVHAQEPEFAVILDWASEMRRILAVKTP
jgi:eukaryotic-like serine/threonine-protein kinase